MLHTFQERSVGRLPFAKRVPIGCRAAADAVLKQTRLSISWAPIPPSCLAAFDPMGGGAIHAIANHYDTDEPFPAGSIVRDPEVIVLAVRLAF